MLISYKYIDLTYIQQVSNGDKVYEKEVIRLFIEQIPDDMVSLKTHFNAGNYVQLKKALHYMLPNISILGLNNKLKNEIEVLESDDSTPDLIETNIEQLCVVCAKARLEAMVLLHSMS